MDDLPIESLPHIKSCSARKTQLRQKWKDLRMKMKNTRGKERYGFKREEHKLVGLMNACDDRKAELKKLRQK